MLEIVFADAQAKCQVARDYFAFHKPMQVRGDTDPFWFGKQASNFLKLQVFL
jgi:hypothetical protein